MSRRYDTTPSEEDRAEARRDVEEQARHGVHTLNAWAVGYLVRGTEIAAEAADERQRARSIALNRALAEALRERWEAQR